LAYAAGITVAAIAWGYLVYLAIDFGTAARGGQASGWALLGLAAVGAMACLFTALMLGARLLVELGITPPPPSGHTGPAASATPVATAEAPPRAATPARQPGGRRRR